MSASLPHAGAASIRGVSHARRAALRRVRDSNRQAFQSAGKDQCTIRANVSKNQEACRRKGKGVRVRILVDTGVKTSTLHYSGRGVGGCQRMAGRFWRAFRTFDSLGTGMKRRCPSERRASAMPGPGMNAGRPSDAGKWAVFRRLPPIWECDEIPLTTILQLPRAPGVFVRVGASIRTL